MAQTRHLLVWTALVAGFCSGCAAVSSDLAPQPPPAPPGIKVQAWVQTNRAGDEKHVFVLNHTDAPVVVDLIQLYGCVNVLGPCTSVDPDLTVAPGETQRLAVVQREIPEGAYSFEYTYRWRPADGPR